MKKNIAPIAAAIIAILCIIFLGRPMGSLPAIGPFLSPSEGYLQNRETSRDLVDGKLPNGLTEDSATVVFDSLLIPHIYAQSDLDAYRLQGYILAKNRYWQMDFISRVAAGRLSEAVGPMAVEFDRKQREKGLAKSAKITNQAWKKYPISYGYLEAFSQGVNAYVNQLTPSSLPIEFKLLGYEAEKWSPYKSALFFKHMSSVLCSREKDFEMTNARRILGDATFNLLYPERDTGSTPVIPSEKVYSFRQDIQEGFSDPLNPAFGALNRPFPSQPKGLGSNNWVVEGSRTKNKNPLLANDPHLPLTLPSIWYVVHIHTPDQNTMGVCFPGIPGVILGFNDDIAWGVTNVGQDVLDWLIVDWSPEASTYQWGNETRRIEWEKETINIKGEKSVIDSVPWTEYGPIMTIETMDGPKDAIMRWLAHEVPDSDEMSVFPGINKSKNWKEFQGHISKYNSPPQNFVFASTSGNIGLQVQGNFPFRSRKFGRFIGEANSSNTWKTHIPKEHVPSILNPGQGFLSSANQVSTDSTYPYYYINADFRPSRGRTINNALKKMTQATVEDMRRLQLNNYNSEAHALVQAMLPFIESGTPYREDLETWDGFFHADCSTCSLVSFWEDELEKLLYDELDFENTTDLEYPSPWTTIALVKSNPNHQIWDNAETPAQDTAASIIRLSLGSATDRFNKLEKQDWASVRNTRITHIIPSLESFGHYNISAGGSPSSPNALRDTKGPSWRMIIDVQKNPKALAVYPGGQSGHPGSKYYDNLLDAWAKGEYYEMQAAPVPDELTTPFFTLQSISHEAE